MLEHLKKLLLVVIICIFTFITNVYADSKNEVKLNFKNGIIHDGYVEYSNIANLQLFKGDDLVTDISNNMVIDLNEAEYEFVIEEIEDTSISGANTPIKLNINNWYYPMTTVADETKSTFKLETNKFSGTLDIKIERTNIAINTSVENVYNNISSKGVIDLTNGQEYVIDLSNTDELTKGLESFVDLDKTLYYKKDNNGLSLADNESEAVIKIVGNKEENKAILTAVNVGTKKSEIFKGLHTKYTGSKLTFTGTEGDILSETRTDYYTKCTYEFTFKYVKEEVDTKEYKFILGANQTYIINESQNIMFKIDAEYNLFENSGKVYIDGKLIDAKNYKAESGSTVITLNKDYVDSLSAGEHIIKVEFNDGGAAITNFEVKVKQVNTEKTENIANPQTGDNIMAHFKTFAVSVLGIITAIVINNKKKREN